MDPAVVVDTRSDSANLRLVAMHAETRGYDQNDLDARPEYEYEYERPERLGRYIVLDEIGRGGMGLVWTAYDPKLDRKVALKLLKGPTRVGKRQARFIREAQALARLNHPNIVTVHDVDTHDGRLYMAMELVVGQTLRKWLASVRGVQEIIEVFVQAGRGLAAAHTANLTHRDFKPSNVLIANDGRVKVVDFGLAKHIEPLPGGPSVEEDVEPSPDEGAFIADAKTQAVSEPPDSAEIMAVISSSSRGDLTQVGRVVGTPHYMAPEQYGMLIPPEVGAWTDQFCFGVAMYEALYGTLPFEGVTPYERYENIRTGRFGNHARDASVPAWLLRVLQRTMCFMPDDRYPSMEAVLEELLDDPERRRRRWLGRGATAGVLGLGLLGVVSALTTHPEVTVPPRPCTGAAQHMAAVWDGTAQDSVKAAMGSSTRSFAADTAERVIEGIDDYTQDWAQQHTAICEATRVQGEQSEALLDVRMMCLDRRRGELSALIDVLGTADDTIVLAGVGAVEQLRRPEPCAVAQPGVEPVVPEDPLRRVPFVEIRDQLDRAGAVTAAGRHAEGGELAQEAGDRAAREGFVHLRARAYLIEGRALRRQRRPKLSGERLREAIAIASSNADVHIEVHAWLDLMFVVGAMLDDRSSAEELEFGAQAAVRRAGSSSDLTISLAMNKQAIRLKQGRVADGLKLGVHALHALEAKGQRESLVGAHVLSNLGIMATQGGDAVAGERWLRESLVLKRQLLGPQHPAVASSALNLANVLVKQANESDNDAERNLAFNQAEEIYRGLVELRGEPQGSDIVHVARALTMLGVAQKSRRNFDEARSSYERAIAMLRAVPNAADSLVVALGNLGNVEQETHNYEAAEGYHREAMSISIANHGPGHVQVADIRFRLCKLFEGTGRSKQARAECERALNIYQDRPGEQSASKADAIREVIDRLDTTPGRTRGATER